MARVWSRFITLMRWLLATERLPDAPDERMGAATRTRGFLAWLFEGDSLLAEGMPESSPTGRREFTRSVLSTEELPAPADPIHPGAAPSRSFWRWIFHSEELDYEEAAEFPSIRRTKFLGRLLKAEECPQEACEAPARGHGFLRWVFSSESCPEAEEFAPLRSGRTRFLHRLLKAEDCPQDTPAPLRWGHGFVRWISSSESCPEERELMLHQGGGFLRWISASEMCPEEGPPRTQRRRGFLRWLLAREQL